MTRDDEVNLAMLRNELTRVNGELAELRAQLNFIEENEAWLTYASDEAGTEKAWLCQVAARHFPSPDIRERSGRVGYGKTARDAIRQAMETTDFT